MLSFTDSLQGMLQVYDVAVEVLLRCFYRLQPDQHCSDRDCVDDNMLTSRVHTNFVLRKKSDYCGGILPSGMSGIFGSFEKKFAHAPKSRRPNQITLAGYSTWISFDLPSGKLIAS